MKMKYLQMFFVLAILLVVMACGGGDDSEDEEDDTDIPDVAGTYDKVVESANCSDLNLEDVSIIEQDGEDGEGTIQNGIFDMTLTANDIDCEATYELRD